MDLRLHLRNRARQSGISYAEIQRRHLLEGLARRIFSLPDADQVVIRGSWATSLWLKPFPRKVMDLDLMTWNHHPVEWGKDFLTRALKVEIPGDGIEVLSSFLNFKETFVYTSPGLKVKFRCRFGKFDQWLGIDLAGRDTLTLPPEWLTVEALHPGMDFTVHTVAPEQAAAWKMHGPFEFWDTSGTWRIKDIFDLVMMFRGWKMVPEKLHPALAMAFYDKNTPPGVCRRFVNGEFGHSRGSRRAWDKFLMENQHRLKQFKSLEDMLQEAEDRLNPYYRHFLESPEDPYITKVREARNAARISAEQGRSS